MRVHYIVRFEHIIRANLNFHFTSLVLAFISTRFRFLTVFCFRCNRNRRDCHTATATHVLFSCIINKTPLYAHIVDYYIIIINVITDTRLVHVQSKPKLKYYICLCPFQMINISVDPLRLQQRNSCII